MTVTIQQRAESTGKSYKLKRKENQTTSLTGPCMPICLLVQTTPRHHCGVRLWHCALCVVPPGNGHLGNETKSIVVPTFVILYIIIWTWRIDENKQWHRLRLFPFRGHTVPVSHPGKWRVIVRMRMLKTYPFVCVCRTRSPLWYHTRFWFVVISPDEFDECCVAL